MSPLFGFSPPDPGAQTEEPESISKTPTEALQQLTPDTRAIARAVALLWTWRPRTAVYNLLRYLLAKSPGGKAFTQVEVQVALDKIRRLGLLREHDKKTGYLCLVDAARAALYRELLDDTPTDALRDALYLNESYQPWAKNYYWPVGDLSATIALVRFELFSGAPASALEKLKTQIERRHDWNGVLQEACFQAFDPALFERVAPEWRWGLAYYAVSAVCERWSLDSLPVYRWLLGKLDGGASELPDYVRLLLAETLLHRGEGARIESLLADDSGGGADALRAAVLVQAGRWAEGQAAFEAAFKKLQTETGARKRLLPTSVAWLYPLALLAQQTPKHLEQARKFCLGESGTRNPTPFDGWGLWVNAAASRLGDAPLEKKAFNLYSDPERYLDVADLWRCLLRAWLGAEALGESRTKKAQGKREEVIAALRQRLQSCGFAWLDGQLAAAESVFAGGEAPEGFFVAGGQEAWRTVLASLLALGGETADTGGAPATRILWSIQLDKGGGVEDVQPLEQKRGPRGWSKPKPLPLARLAGNEKLEPWDAKAARAIKQDRAYQRRYRLDRAAAVMALVGHPAVVLADAPDTTVDVVEGTPELEVTREQGRFVLSLSPPPRAEPEPAPYAYLADSEERRELDALRLIHVLRDSPQRVRIIRLTPAQRRAAHLIAGRFAVPADAQVQLQETLQALAGHFHIHSDHAEAAREVAAENRLRAELSPAGDSLMLRLVAAPLGPEGPRLMPGTGRLRVMAAVKGESVGAQRDLEREQAHLDAVLAALPFLDPPAPGDLVCEWLVDDPEQSLGMVEILPALPAVQAVDWPKGQAVRVITVDPARVAVRVKSERDWFRVQGSARLDEKLVVDLEALLAAAAGKRRFVPMGKGVYAALTRELRERLAELAAVAETGRDGLRVPQLTAAWLDELLQGVQVDADAGFRGKIEQLRAAQDAQPGRPHGLQAELRPYQEDGYAWAMRLAEAGFGACLADDMGLGKTIQALAVLLARAGGGPALVVAPTSVCGNWLAETRRFAPTLNPMIYGEGERAALVESAAARDVVIVSYTLMQQAQEVFAARTWHTLVADEAQAVKNASAKRSQALFELPADFRLALSGTPVENRLAELWSIMRYCNPGLLGTLPRFNERFAAPIERHRDRDAQRLLRRLIAPFVLRRTKAEVLQELPPRTELVLTVAAEAAEAAHYEALRRHAVAEAENAAAEIPSGQAHLHILAQLTRLRRAACDPRLTSPDLGIVGAKSRAFAELAAELSANGHKTLVFSQFVDFLTLLREPLDEAGIPYQYLDGATPAAERTRRVAAFQAGEGDLFLISLKAGGFGLNLTAADYVVIADPWWNPAAEDQAMGRAHRIGQQRPVTVYRLVSKGTLEERIVELHHDKRALAEGVLEGGEGAVLPSTEELISLIRGG